MVANNKSSIVPLDKLLDAPHWLTALRINEGDACWMQVHDLHGNTCTCNAGSYREAASANVAVVASKCCAIPQ